MKKYDGWLEISNIKKFTEYLRNIVYINFKDDNQDDSKNYQINLGEDLPEITDEEKKELSEILTQKECIVIVKETSKKIIHKKTKNIKYLINDNILFKLIEDFNQRMTSNIIAKLVKRGILESAYDDEKNDFIFWKND
jgi:hypothetical protein